MRRLVALLMTACLVGTMLVGCGQKEEGTSKSDVQTKEEVVEKTESEETASATTAGGEVRSSNNLVLLGNGRSSESSGSYYSGIQFFSERCNCRSKICSIC